MRSEWVPVVGEIVWIRGRMETPKLFEQHAPIFVAGHFALIMHVTPGESVKTRYVWFFVLHSTKSRIPPDEWPVFFQYNYLDRYGTAIDEHDPTSCGLDCRHFLYLDPGKGSISMNMPGYVDIGNMFQLPLDYLRPKSGLEWHLRDCSFSLLADEAKNLIADRMARWVHRSEAQVLLQKLDLSPLPIDGLLCWVGPASGRLVDRNGISYRGGGLCVVMEVNLRTAKIYILLDNRKPDKKSPGFTGIANDPNIVTEEVIPPQAYHIFEVWTPQFSLPAGTSRRTLVTEQYLVLEPAFEVSVDDLYRLPSCYMPTDTRICAQETSCLRELASARGQSIARCAEVRNRIYAEALQLSKETKEEKKERQSIAGEKKHREVLQGIESALEIADKTTYTTVIELRAERVMATYYDDFNLGRYYVEWKLVRSIAHTALAELKQEGPLPQADNEEVNSPEQERRARIITAIHGLLRALQKARNTDRQRQQLRDAFEPIASK